MPDTDDGGFARREGAGGGVPAPYFECERTEQACEDMSEADVKSCGCLQCQGYLQYVAECDEAEADAAEYEASQEAAPKCGCGETKFKDCTGRFRCETCDDPCPLCQDS